VLGFAADSALCGLAWNLDSLIAFRILQAVPGGILPVVTLTMLYQIVPLENIGAAMGLYGLGVVVAPAVGPVLGGYLVEFTDWRVIFYINVPIGIFGAALALAVFPRVRPTTWPRFDLWGFLTIAYALFALLLAFSEGQSWGWTGYRVIILFASALISLALFVIIELEVDNPIIDLRVFRCYPYTLSLVLISITTTALFTGLYFLPQFLQQVQGMQSLDAGLVLTPAAMVLLVLMPVSGRIYDLIGPRYPGHARAGRDRGGLVRARAAHAGHHPGIHRVVARGAQRRRRARHDADHDQRGVGAVAAAHDVGQCDEQHHAAGVVERRGRRVRRAQHRRGRPDDLRPRGDGDRCRAGPAVRRLPAAFERGDHAGLRQRLLRHGRVVRGRRAAGRDHAFRAARRGWRVGGRGGLTERRTQGWFLAIGLLAERYRRLPS
jgi:MFS family permease